MGWLTWALLDSPIGRAVGWALGIVAAGLALLAIGARIAHRKHEAVATRGRLDTILATQEIDRRVERIIEDVGPDGLADLLAGRGYDRLHATGGSAARFLRHRGADRAAR